MYLKTNDQGWSVTKYIYSVGVLVCHYTDLIKNGKNFDFPLTIQTLNVTFCFPQRTKEEEVKYDISSELNF